MEKSGNSKIVTRKSMTDSKKLSWEIRDCWSENKILHMENMDIVVSAHFFINYALKCSINHQRILDKITRQSFCGKPQEPYRSRRNMSGVGGGGTGIIICSHLIRKLFKSKGRRNVSILEIFYKFRNMIFHFHCCSLTKKIYISS